jgi:hypothetical protein
MAASKGTPRGKTASRRFIKIGLGLVLLVVLGFLFMRSVRGTRAAPYTIARESMRPWSLALVKNAPPDEAMLMLRPPVELTGVLFGQLFKRAMESMSTLPSPGIPLMLSSEFARAQAGHPTLTPEAVLAAAHEAGLDAVAPQPRCMAHRRIAGGANGGGDREQLYFLIFDAPAFQVFRQGMAARLNDGAAVPALFDPTLLSPALLLAFVESTADHWFPLRADAKVDCVAPIAISDAPPG